MQQEVPVSPLPQQGNTPRLLDRVRVAARSRGHSAPTTEILVAWIIQFILLHDRQHPSSLGLPAVTRFLEHVVRTEPHPLPALAMTRSALSLLYSAVLGIDLGELPQPLPPRL